MDIFHVLHEFQLDHAAKKSQTEDTVSFHKQMVEPQSKEWTTISVFSS
jgi:hypothetical protein